MQYDYVIVGGGSAGSVLASRLSETSSKSVLLIEAGIDTPPHGVPDVIGSGDPEYSYFDPRYHWEDFRVHYRSYEEARSGRDPALKLEQGKVLGGGSSINGQIAFRGLPHDYDEWAALGLRGWAYADVLPYFRKLERDVDFPHDGHGRDGPIPIRRLFPDSWPGFTTACLESLRAEGYRYFDDGNGDSGDGCLPMPMSNQYDRRVSAAIGYLGSAVRRRSNLRIQCKTRVLRLLFEGGRAVSVEAECDGRLEIFHGRDIIVSAGALSSPAILMRSGIGPAGHLAEHGIAVIRDLPGVGENLREHPETAIVCHLHPAARIGAGLKRAWFLGLRYSSGHADCTPGDMFILPLNKTAWHPLGRSLGSIVVAVHKTYSQGVVRLRSADPNDYPVVAFNMLSDERDLVRLVDGMRLAHRMARAAPVRACTNEWFLGKNDDEVRAIGVPTRLNRLKTGLAARLLDCGPSIRRGFMRLAITDSLDLDRTFADDRALTDWVRSSAWSSWHPTGTCKMGVDGDRWAVLDASCRVRGVGGLRVVDASIMPTIVTANTNIPTIMIGERMADAIRSE